MTRTWTCRKKENEPSSTPDRNGIGRKAGDTEHMQENEEDRKSRHGGENNHVVGGLAIVVVVMHDWNDIHASFAP